MGRILNSKIKNFSKHTQQSMIIVDFNSPGIKIVRALDSFGLYDAPGFYLIFKFLLKLFKLKIV